MSELPLNMALDNIEFGTLVVDANGIVTFYSRSYERFLGIPRAQVLGRHVAEVIENTRMHIVLQIGGAAPSAGASSRCWRLAVR